MEAVLFADMVEVTVCLVNHRAATAKHSGDIQGKNTRQREARERLTIELCGPRIEATGDDDEQRNN